MRSYSLMKRNFIWADTWRCCQLAVQRNEARVRNKLGQAGHLHSPVELLDRVSQLTISNIREANLARSVKQLSSYLLDEIKEKGGTKEYVNRSDYCSKQKSISISIYGPTKLQSRLQLATLLLNQCLHFNEPYYEQNLKFCILSIHKRWLVSANKHRLINSRDANF